MGNWIFFIYKLRSRIFPFQIGCLSPGLYLMVTEDIYRVCLALTYFNWNLLEMYSVISLSDWISWDEFPERT